MKAGRVYLMIDPNYDTDDIFYLQRLVLPRVPVTLRKIHRASIRRRYEVEYLGRTYTTGRLQKVKTCS